MSKREQELLDKLKPFGIVTWNQLLAVPNEAKTIFTRYKLNGQRGYQLVKGGHLRKANLLEVVACQELHNKHTRRVIGRLERAVECGSWGLVKRLADYLETREFDASLFVVVG